MPDSEFITAGEISGVFGVKGWVKVFSFTDPRENIFDYSPWILKSKNATQVVKVVKGQRQGKGLVACLDGVTHRDEAAAFCGYEILIRKNQLPETAKDEFYWSDLIGLKVETDQGIKLGIVDHLIETGANDVLAIKDDENIERLIPFLQDQVIKKIDLNKSLIIVDWDPDF